jgi:hypothetical protein
MGAGTSAKLHADFAAYARTAKKYFARTNRVTGKKLPAWMWETYREFRKLFKLASDGGFVSYW